MIALYLMIYTMWTEGAVLFQFGGQVKKAILIEGIVIY